MAEVTVSVEAGMMTAAITDASRGGWFDDVAIEDGMTPAKLTPPEP